MGFPEVCTQPSWTQEPDRFCILRYRTQPIPEEYDEFEGNTVIWDEIFSYETWCDREGSHVNNKTYNTQLLEIFHKHVDVVVHFTREGHWEMWYEGHPMIQNKAGRRLGEFKKVSELLFYSYLTRM